jgi:hypothetical protein
MERLKGASLGQALALPENRTGWKCLPRTAQAYYEKS